MAEAVRRRWGSDGAAVRCGSTASRERAVSAESADLKSASAAAGVGVARAVAAAGEVGGTMDVEVTRRSHGKEWRNGEIGRRRGREEMEKWREEGEEEERAPCHLPPQLAHAAADVAKPA